MLNGWICTGLISQKRDCTLKVLAVWPTDSTLMKLMLAMAVLGVLVVSDLELLRIFDVYIFDH